jgi:heme-degrading monooxygenase HmoA
MSTLASKSLFHINLFAPTAGRLDDFITAQLDAIPRLGVIRGLNTSRLYRAEDGSRAIVVAGFDSIEAHREFQNSAAFQAERARLQPLLDGVQPGFYRLIHERDRSGSTD